jgi:hypothetical protein
LEELICDGPPPTLAAIGEFALGYIAALEAIAEAHADDPLLAAQEALRATMRLSAGLSPPGSPGPAHVLLAPVLEAVLEMRTGTPPSLLRHAPPRNPASHPSAPHIILGRALAAAVMSLLMEQGVRRADAMRLVARRLQRAGVEFRGRNANPPHTIDGWREQAKDPYRGSIHDAYREMHQQLVFRQTMVRPETRKELLLRALDEGVARGLFNMLRHR